ncbi:MAG: hypothetical protein GXP54_02205 [Deltaproteobacteria bacterium]|nr:hypothetical protein [Deltaproteobacteria bacterium]
MKWPQSATLECALCLCIASLASCGDSGAPCKCGDAVETMDSTQAMDAPSDLGGEDSAQTDCLSPDAECLETTPLCESESCNGRDDDCDGQTDEEDAEGCQVLYFDGDADGFGVTDDFRCLCGAEGLYTATDGGDCDDGDISINPDGVEAWDGVDQDCNGIADDGIDVLVVEGGGTAHHPSVVVIPGQDAVNIGWVEGRHTYLWGKSYHLGRLAAGGVVEPLFQEGQDTFLYHSDSHLARDSGGILHAVWHVSGTMAEEMAYTSVAPDGTAGPATQITTMDGPNTDLPHVVVDGGGGIHTVWASDHVGIGISNLYYRKFRRDPDNGSVIPLIGDTTGVPLTDAVTEHPMRRFDMILDQAGDLVIVYVEGNDLALLVLDADSGAPIIGPIPTTPSGMDTPMLFQTPDGTLHLALIIGGVAHYAHLGLDGTLLLGPVPVSGPDATAPGILVSSEGVAVMFWVAYAPSGVREVFMRHVDPDTGLPLDLPAAVTPDDGVSSRILRGYYSLDTSADGAMHLVWWDTAEEDVQSVHYMRFAP